MIDFEIIDNLVAKVCDSGYKIDCRDETLELVDQEFISYFGNPAGNYFLFLLELVKLTKPESVVELGNREGVSTLMLYEHLPETSKFKTVDIIPNLKYVPNKVKEDKRLSCVFGSSISDSIVDSIEDRSVDILFIDTLHTSEHARKELDLYEPKLKDNAIILMDDISWPGMEKCWESISHEKRNYKQLHGSGFGVILFDRMKMKKS